MTDGELLEILDKTFHVDSNGFVHYQSAKAWLHYGQLVAAAERDACASLCSTVAAGRDAEAIEEAIRARGEK